MRKGRPLERLVAALERALGTRDGVSIQSPGMVRDKTTGEMREHDVLVTYPSAHHKVVLAIECRDRKKLVGSPDVEAFQTKCVDTGINKGVIVSSTGFSKPCIAKAARYGITCLELEKVDSFPWMLAPGMQLRTQHLINTAWTFIPEKDIEPKPVDFSIIGADGTLLALPNLTKLVQSEISRLPEEASSPGTNKKRFRFPCKELFILDALTKERHPITSAIAEATYEVRDELVPFELVKYTDKGAGETVTDAAVANVTLGAQKGRFVFVMKENEGGQLLWIPEQKC